MALVERMATARKDRGMTQKQLADHLKVKQATVSMLETGELSVDEIGEGLTKLIKDWIDSGAGPRKKPARGPYKARNTLPGRE